MIAGHEGDLVVRAGDEELREGVEGHGVSTIDGLQLLHRLALGEAQRDALRRGDRFQRFALGGRGLREIEEIAVDHQLHATGISGKRRQKLGEVRLDVGVEILEFLGTQV